MPCASIGVWLDALPAAARALIALNLNLDSIAGAPSLTALTSAFPALGGFVQDAARAAGFQLAVHEPLMPNSANANLAAHGISMLQLQAGFNEPGSNLRHLLTGADRPTRSANCWPRCPASAQSAH